MAQWRCDVRIFRRTQLFSLLAHGVLVLLILISPWPAGYGPIWLVLLILVAFQGIRSQKHLAAVQGELRLLEDWRINWHGPKWRLVKKPWMPGYGILLLILHPMEGNNKYQWLWLVLDNMKREEWRYLRQCLLYPPVSDNKADETNALAGRGSVKNCWDVVSSWNAPLL